MTDPARFAAATSRRLRLAALTVIALLAVKVAAAAFADPGPAPAGTAIVPAASPAVSGNT